MKNNTKKRNTECKKDEDKEYHFIVKTIINGAEIEKRGKRNRN